MSKTALHPKVGQPAFPSYSSNTFSVTDIKCYTLQSALKKIKWMKSGTWENQTYVLRHGIQGKH